MAAETGNPSPGDGWFTRSTKTITAAAAAVGAILGVVVAYDPAVTAWCKNFGVLCTYDVETPVRVVKVTDGNPCDSATPQICVERTPPKRLLDTSSYKFLRQVTAAQFEEVKPRPALVQDSAGWFVDPKNPPTPAKICIIVFAHTTACERKQSITGKLVAKETQPLSSLWKKDVLVD